MNMWATMAKVPMSATALKHQKRPKSCYLVGAGLVLYLVGAVLLVVCVHLNVVPILGESNLFRTHLMCGAFGMLGSSIATIRRYYRALLTETTAVMEGKPNPPLIWDFAWVFYYLTRPILGGILGALTFTLSFIGLQILATPVKPEVSNQGKYLLFALAFVSGFAVGQVLDRLNSVAKEVFEPRPGQKL